MAQFRDLLLHRYWEVDPARVLRYARENLGDFEAFLAAIDRLPEQEGRPAATERTALMPEEPGVRQLQQLAAESVLGTPNLTDELTDGEARPLIDWAWPRPRPPSAKRRSATS